MTSWPRRRRDARRGFCCWWWRRRAFQAASSEFGARPRVGKLRIQRWSSVGSIIVAFPLFRAVNAPSRIASKILVRLTPALAAASSGLNPSRRMVRPVVLFWWIVSMAHHCVRGTRPHAMVLTLIRRGSRADSNRKSETNAPPIVAH